jgi:hypothetical protein
MKNLTKLGFIVLVMVIGFGMAACDDGTTAHTHTWGAWQTNATQHWKECDCGEEYGRANHTGTPNCSVCGFTTTSVNLSLDGVWQSDDAVNRMVITIYGSNGLFTEIKSDSPWKSTSVKIGDQKFKSISKTGDLTWSSENLVYNTSDYTTSWTNTTITMNADGQTFTTTTPGTFNISATYKRTQ